LRAIGNALSAAGASGDINLGRPLHGNCARRANLNAQPAAHALAGIHDGDETNDVRILPDLADSLLEGGQLLLNLLGLSLQSG